LDGIDLYVFVVAFALISVFVGRFGVEFFAFCWMTLFSVFFFVALALISVFFFLVDLV